MWWDGINDIYHNDDDSQSPFWSFLVIQEFNDPGNGYKAEFQKTIATINQKNNKTGTLQPEEWLWGIHHSFFMEKE